jgi:putative intracellular protease/amidase
VFPEYLRPPTSSSVYDVAGVPGLPRKDEAPASRANVVARFGEFTSATLVVGAVVTVSASVAFAVTLAVHHPTEARSRHAVDCIPTSYGYGSNPIRSARLSQSGSALPWVV